MNFEGREVFDYVVTAAKYGAETQISPLARELNQQLIPYLVDVFSDLLHEVDDLKAQIDQLSTDPGAVPDVRRHLSERLKQSQADRTERAAENLRSASDRAELALKLAREAAARQEALAATQSASRSSGADAFVSGFQGGVTTGLQNRPEQDAARPPPQQSLPRQEPQYHGPSCVNGPNPYGPGCNPVR